MLDGLDELKFNEKSIFINELESFMNKFENLSIVLSTRPESVSNMLPMFSEYKMQKMSENQIVKYVKKLPNQNHKDELLEKILQPKYFREHKDMLGHPLILAILILTFDFNGELPVNPAQFYSTFYSTMLRTHDRDKETSFEREIKTKLSHSKLEKLIMLFCFFSYVDHQFSFNKDEINYYIDKAIDKFNRIQEIKIEIEREDFLGDIRDVLCFIIEEGPNYDFLHRSFQEFYTAKFILDLDDDIQVKFFNNDENFLFIERGGVLDYLRLIDEKKYLFTGLYPIIKQLIKDFDSHKDIGEFIKNNVDIISFSNMEENRYYIMYQNLRYSTAREELLSIRKETINYSTMIKEKIKENKNFKNEYQITEMPSGEFTELLGVFEEIMHPEINHLKEWVIEYETNREKHSLGSLVFDS